MTFRKTLGIVAALVLSFQTWADELKINPNRPDQYTVVRGDTLWDISGKFLQQPWLWPQLWRGNPHIKNPHLIYPKDVLYFSMVDGRPYLSLTRGNGRNIKLHPSIRKEDLEEAIKMIPTDAIAQFLSSPKVVEKGDLDKAPYVVDFPDEHIVVGSGDRAYVRKILEPKTVAYTFFRQGEAYIRPVTKEILGYEALYLGEAVLKRAGDPATFVVTKSNGEIRVGDRLIPSTEDDFALNFFPVAPSQRIQGSIISVLNGVAQIGRNNIVVIDRGTEDGVKVGHVLDIYQRGRLIKDPVNTADRTLLKLPDEKAGTLMIFRPFKRVSYALIMNASGAIHLLDKVKNP